MQVEEVERKRMTSRLKVNRITRYLDLRFFKLRKSTSFEKYKILSLVLIPFTM